MKQLQKNLKYNSIKIQNAQVFHKKSKISRSGAKKSELTSNSTARLAAKSALLPDSAMTMFVLASLCSSFTHDLARTNES